VSVDPPAVRRVVLASGKISLDLMGYRQRPAGVAPVSAGVAIVRVEQLYPWPEAQIAAALARYPEAVEVVWAQEEPENMGGWWFARAKLHKLLGGDGRLSSVARLPSGSAATGSAAVSTLEAEDLMVRAFGGR
jgi:2-oxoglutarate dehydrogenase complex dehydrogenase (E1) component-like enzyme